MYLQLAFMFALMLLHTCAAAEPVLRGPKWSKSEGGHKQAKQAKRRRERGSETGGGAAESSWDCGAPHTITLARPLWTTSGATAAGGTETGRSVLHIPVVAVSDHGKQPCPGGCVYLGKLESAELAPDGRKKTHAAQHTTESSAILAPPYYSLRVTLCMCVNHTN